MSEIQFITVDKKLDNEKKSKLLSPDSSLYGSLKKCRDNLLKDYSKQIDNQRMDFHIELVSANEDYSVDKLLTRAKQINGSKLDLTEPKNWLITRKAVMVNTGIVDGYGQTHSTVAFFPSGVAVDVTADKLISMV